MREVRRLHAAVKNKKNVSTIKVHSFEFLLLSFGMLEEWVFAEEDDLRRKRSRLLELKNVFVDIVCNGGDDKQLLSIKEMIDGDESLNTEQLAAKLLYNITRNTGFETTKGKLGNCFIIDCCDWDARSDDDICGLDNARIDANRKIKDIYEHSVLKEAFVKAGLE